MQAFVALSSPFDTAGLQPHFARRGLAKRLYCAIMSDAGEAGLHAYSPLSAIQSARHEDLAAWPLVLLLHGTLDATVPCSESLKLCDALKAKAVPVRLSCRIAWCVTTNAPHANDRVSSTKALGKPSNTSRQIQVQ